MIEELEGKSKKIKEIEEKTGMGAEELFALLGEPCAQALDLLWNDIILSNHADYGPWEYPAQAYRHLLAEYNELKVELEKVNFYISIQLKKGLDTDEELERTKEFYDHPGWYDYACLCHSCRSYGD